MTNGYNAAGFGEAKDVAELLNTSDHAESFMVPALINALRRIDHLECQIERLTEKP